MKKILICTLLLLNFNSFSKELEGFLGAAYTKFDDVDGYDAGGASARLKYNLYSSGKGLFVYSNFRGDTVLNFDAILGYGFRSKGKWFFEAGGGVAYSFYFGPGGGAILSTGVDLGDSWFLTLPLVLRLGGLSYLQVSPMIGLRF